VSGACVSLSTPAAALSSLLPTSATQPEMPRPPIVLANTKQTALVAQQGGKGFRMFPDRFSQCALGSCEHTNNRIRPLRTGQQTFERR
jgi:hypothetical protein